MKNIELVIDDEVVSIPEELNIGMYQEINKNQIKYKNPLHLISLFTNMTIHELKNLKTDQIQLIEGFLGDKFTLPTKTELVLTFEYEGVEYGLENDWSKLAWGAWVDFEVYSADDTIFTNIDKIMAILYRPVVSKDKKNPMKYKIVPYKSEEIEERAEVMKLVPVRYWLGASTFFLQIVNIYITSIKASLESKLKLQQMTMVGWKKLPKFIQKRLPLDSILPSLTNSQKKMLESFMK